MIRGLHLKRPFIACICGVACLGASQPSMPPVVGSAPVTWLIFVDDLHLDFRNTGRLRNAMKLMAAELIQDGDRFAVVSSGPSTLAVDVTADRQWLEGAIKKTTGNGLRFTDIAQGANASAEARYRASIAATTAQDILNNASRLAAGAKALLYISNGYSFDLLPDTPAAPPFDVSRAAVREQLSELVSMASRAGVKIFAIDPRIAFNDGGLDPDHPEWQAHQAAMRSSLRSISEPTGGFAIVEGNFTTELKRIATAMRPQ